MKFYPNHDLQPIVAFVGFGKLGAHAIPTVSDLAQLDIPRDLLRLDAGRRGCLVMEANRVSMRALQPLSRTRAYEYIIFTYSHALKM